MSKTSKSFEMWIKLHLGVTMLVFYKNWQGIGESPVRNEFHR